MTDAPTVLLVDDEVHILSALERTLRKEGWSLRTADSPAAALDVFSQEPVAMVVSDQKMPGGSGLELLTEVSRQSPETRRVLLTGWPEMLTAAELEAAGLDAVLPKPWEDAELKRTLRELL